MQFKQIIKRAQEIRDMFQKYEKKNVGKIWAKEQILEGLIVDIGDLTRLIMAKEGYRKVDDVDRKLEHELSDCLWAIIILASKYNIDLEKAFFDTMNELDAISEIDKKNL